MSKVEMPEELIRLFERSNFCPDDAIRGRPEAGTAWSSLEMEYDAGGEADYPTGYLYYVCHWNGEVTKATRAFAQCSGKHDALFLKSVVDWFQSMTQAREVKHD